MDKNSSIIIEKIGNGWWVRPYFGERAPGPLPLTDFLGFQELQYDGQGVQHSEKCLFGFLLKHFPNDTKGS